MKLRYTIYPDGTVTDHKEIEEAEKITQSEAYQSWLSEIHAAYARTPVENNKYRDKIKP